MNTAQVEELGGCDVAGGADLLPLLSRSPGRSNAASAVVVGHLVAIADEATPMVVFPDQVGSAAVSARSVIKLLDTHVGDSVVLTFEQGDLSKPIILGVLRESTGGSLKAHTGTVDVDADGSHVVVTAGERLVLRCGSASITLTKAGKVLIEGTYVSSRSSGVNRVKGGSVQLN